MWWSAFEMKSEGDGAILIASFQVGQMIDANVISCLSEISNEGFSGHSCMVLLIDAQQANCG